MELNLKGKVALVVASGQGLGKAIAKELIKEGAHVMITDIDSNKLENAHKELKELQMGKVAYFQADITSAYDIKSLVEAARDVFGKIDILVNNAGGPPTGTFEKFSDEVWQKSFELNLLSYIRMIRETLPDLKQLGGHIINLASSSIKQPIPGLIISNTFRTGIVGLSKTLAEELAPYKILVNTVSPGRINTDRIVSLDKIKAEKNGISVQQVKEESIKNIPLGRYGTPEEFGKVVTFLVSDVNTYMTGGSFLIDGGMVKSI